MKKISKVILCFVSTLEKHLQLNQYQDLFFEIRYIRTKYDYFPFWLNFDFGFFIKPWRNRLCIWIISLETVDADCIISGSLPFKLTTVGEVWWPLQLVLLYSVLYIWGMTHTYLPFHVSSPPTRLLWANWIRYRVFRLAKLAYRPQDWVRLNVNKKPHSC